MKLRSEPNLDKPCDFIIKPYRNHYVLINIKGDRENHTHIKTTKTCKNLVGMVCNKTIPVSTYLQTSAIRISRDKKYCDKVKRKIEKNANKQTYHNVNNGIW